MLEAIRQLDRVLRGDATRLPDLRQGTINVRVFSMLLVVIVLGLIYGACMGSFAAFRVTGPSYEQMLASTVKVPALFLLTLLITFPSLYVFNALVGSGLGIVTLLRLLMAALGVNLAVLASLGPIVAFFSVCTTSYPFMVLLNVVLFAVAGLMSLTFLMQTLHRLSVAQEMVSAEVATPPEEAADFSDSAVGRPPGPLDRLQGQVMGRHVKKVLMCWMVIYGLVGAQMGWVLRPFVGDPTLPFSWFRPRQSNFFEAVLRSLTGLFG